MKRINERCSGLFTPVPHNKLIGLGIVAKIQVIIIISSRSSSSLWLFCVDVMTTHGVYNLLADGL